MQRRRSFDDALPPSPPTFTGAVDVDALADALLVRLGDRLALRLKMTAIDVLHGDDSSDTLSWDTDTGEPRRSTKNDGDS